MLRHDVFVTGGTGYVGRALINRLLERRHAVRALVRPPSVGRVPEGAKPVVGDALTASTFQSAVPPADTLVHLVGVPGPNPTKAGAFRKVDLASITASVEAAGSAGVRHLVYLSVAQPVPLMRAYVQVRKEGEALIRASGLTATFVRPWYILGPGHRWPVLLKPFYTLFERVPATRDGARRMGLVTLSQMVTTLVSAVESPPSGIRIVEVPEIRGGRLQGTG